MHPALSIILFSTLSGAGLGLGFWTGLIHPFGAKNIVTVAGILSIALTSSGLVCSLWHLRRPSRAWRALSQWRSSWLSREGILAPAAMLMLFAFVVSTFLELSWAVPAGFLSSLLCMLAVVCTAMIYGQLKAVPAWNTYLTLFMFLAFAASSGLFLLTAVSIALDPAILDPGSHSDINGQQLLIATLPGSLLPVVTFFANPVSWLFMLAWWIRKDKVGTRTSSIASATQLMQFEDIKQMDPPHVGPNYLTREMGFRIARRHARKLRVISGIVGFLLPLILGFVWFLPIISDALAFAAMFVLHLVGIGIARWLFFAEASHTSMLYYGYGPA